MLINIERELLSRDFSKFVRGAWHLLEESPEGNATEKYVHGRHVDLIGSHLSGVRNGDIKRLVVNVPPGSSKSTLISVLFPCWVWTKDPSASFLCQTYSHDLTLRDAARSRRVIASDWYRARWPHVRFQKDDNSKQYYRIHGGGWRLSTTLGGRATGEHPTYIICDDPLSALEGKNKKKCEEWEEWYKTTIASRGYALGVRHLIVQQRVGYYDASSVLLKQNEEAKLKGQELPVHHVMLPMEFEPDRAMVDRGFGGDWRTTEGQLLFPELIGPKEKETLYRQLGTSANIRAQAQQDPLLSESQVLPMDKMQYVEPGERHDFDLYVRFWDKAATEDGGCQTAGVLLGIKKMQHDTYRYRFLHVHKGHWGVDRVEQEIEKMANLDELKYEGKYIIGLEMEPGSGGVFSANATVKRLRNFTVIPLRTGKSKLARAEPLAKALGYGEVECVRDAWTPDFIQELTDAPSGEFMDQFDAANGAVILGNEEVDKIKKAGRVTRSKKSRMPRCKTRGCNRYARDDGYCCTSCATLDNLGEMAGDDDHTADCNATWNARRRR